MPLIKGESGIDWNYDLEGAGDPLVFIHGWGVDRRIWRQQFKHFSQSYQVMSFDLPGHGDSSWVKVELAVMARDLLNVFDQLGLNQVTLIGSSFGGMLALKVFDESPGKVKRFVFAGSMPKFSQSPDYPFGLEVERMRKLGGQLDSNYPSIVNVFFRSLFTQKERESRRFKWLQKFRQTDVVPMKSALVEYLDILESEDLRHVLVKVNRPVQFITGTEDYICNQEIVRYLRSVKPQARFDMFEECGHFPFLSKPHEFNSVVEDFLKQT